MQTSYTLIFYNFLPPPSPDSKLYNSNYKICGLLCEFAAYCVVAKESVGKQIPIAFLERVKADFKKRYGGGKADTAMAKSLNKEFGYVHSWKSDS